MTNWDAVQEAMGWTDEEIESYIRHIEEQDGDGGGP